MSVDYNAKLQYLVRVVKTDMFRAGVPFNDFYPVTLDTCVGSSLGVCSYKRKAIFINPKMFGREDDVTIKNVICHELIHSADECVREGHRGMWRYYADKMNASGLGYTINRTTLVNETYKTRKVDYKYEIVCAHCGAVSRRKVASNVVKNPWLYKCGRCGFSKLEVFEVVK